LTLPGVKTPVNVACFAAAATRGAGMNQESLRLLIQRKIRDRRLPRDGITRVWSSPSDGETCDACDAVLAKDQLLMEGITLDLGRRPFQFHVRCFQIWDHERRAT
jgi:hypothetical protein